MGDDYERIVLVKPDVFIYKIPPRTTNRGYRASDWKLDEPDWSGRLRVIAKGKECIIKIEDKASGQLFAQCPIEKYPSAAIEAVSDSSRYFVIKIVDDNGRSAFIGIGFADRADSFDVNVALQDHFKWLEKQEEIEKGDALGVESGPKLDLKFKEGQTIKVNLNISKKNSAAGKPKPKGTGILLPPPPGVGAIKIPPPVFNSIPLSNEISSSKSDQKQGNNLLADFEGLTLSAGPATANSDTGVFTGQITTKQSSSDFMADFGDNPKESTTAASNWAQF